MHEGNLVNGRDAQAEGECIIRPRPFTHMTLNESYASESITWLSIIVCIV